MLTRGKLYGLVEPLYSEDEGRRGIGPVVLFKIVLIQHPDGIASLRRTLKEIDMNMACRWFLGYTLREEPPHFSTVRYTFRAYYGYALCPEYQPLQYSATDRDGYREYKSDPKLSPILANHLC